jgi:hypothetical protein
VNVWRSLQKIVQLKPLFRMLRVFSKRCPWVLSRSWHVSFCALTCTKVARPISLLFHLQSAPFYPYNLVHSLFQPSINRLQALELQQQLAWCPLLIYQNSRCSR